MVMVYVPKKSTNVIQVEDYIRPSFAILCKKTAKILFTAKTVLV